MTNVYDSTRERAEADRGPAEYAVPVSSVSHADCIRAVGWADAVRVAGIETHNPFVKVLWEMHDHAAPGPYTIFHQEEWVLSHSNSMEHRHETGAGTGTS